MATRLVRTVGVALLCMAAVAGCRGERDAFQHYLTNEFPGLTAGATEATDAFTGVLSEGANPRKLEQRVIRPYREVVKRLRAYQPDSESVRRHHAAYLKVAERQLQVFEAARDAVIAGDSLTSVAKRLTSVRADLERWARDLRMEAERLDMTPTPAE